MTTHIRLDEFNTDNETIEAYLERVELYFQAAGTKDEVKVPLFLTVIGSKNYNLLRDLLAPAKPREKELDVLFSTLKKHYNPKKVVIVERFHFHKRNQESGESIQEYVAQLRHLALHCEFGEYLDQALRDRFVCGIGNEDIQKKILAQETAMEFTKAVELAVALEAATSQTKEIQDKGEQAVHHMQQVDDQETVFIREATANPKTTRTDKLSVLWRTRPHEESLPF